MKLLARATLGLWIVVAGYFFWSGVTTTPSENDSLGWHIPIAESILEGRVWGKGIYQSPYGYYPAMGEAVLALLMILKIPLNLYNWLGWVVLFLVMRALGKRRGLGSDLATILAAGLVFLPTVMRLFPTQLIDVWLAVWWGWLLWLLEKPGKSLKYWISLGMASGLIAGTKYTGLVLLFLAAVVYFKKLKKVWNLRGVLWLIVIFLLIGGFWYFRNWMVWGDPLYPQNFLWFKGYQPFQLPIIWKDLLLTTRGWGLLIQALFSEYLIWGGLVLLPVVYRNAWVWMGIAIVGMYLILPGDPRTVISNLRYVVPGFMVLILAAGDYFRKKRQEEWMGTVAAVNAVSVLPQLDYHPKVWLAAMIVWAGILWQGKYGKSHK
jgi:4-amino-4-deoxy-L-arabinose transferase-like glycosyltransferase